MPVRMICRSLLGLTTAALLGAAAQRVHAAPLGSAFTYQGQLQQSGSPANGTCDLQFSLFAAASGGTQVGSTQTASPVSVTNGLFTVQLDFGSSAFGGDGRWLQIALRCPVGNGLYTTLTPRQLLTAAPYALYAPSSGSASDVACTGCVGATDLAAGAVTSNKIAPGAVQQTNLAFTPGTVTSVTAGTGLTGGTITTTGTIAANIGTTAGTVAAGNHNHDTTYWSLTGNAATNPNVNFLGTTDNQPVVLKTNGTERLRVDASGNVGIGTSTPDATLAVVGNTTNVANNTAYFYDPAIGPAVSHIHYGTTGDWYIRSAATNGKVVLQDEGGGSVSIGPIYADAGATLAVRSSPGQTPLVVGGPCNGAYCDPQFVVAEDSSVLIRNPTYGVAPTATHLCINPYDSILTPLGPCSSAAEYVPAVGNGFGYAEAGDLVRILPTVDNPYADDHSPFVVAKTSKPCDEHLLGFLLKPELGADGKKLNDHYLPLAIYGYFPAKVTLENGPIKRGDPITSSSKPGYGMKATQACKIIGYALEDADREGTIQVFAHLSEYAAPQVAALQGQVQALQQENQHVRAQFDQIQSQLQAVAAGIGPKPQESAPLALQGQRTATLEALIAAQQRQNAALQEQNTALEARLTAVEHAVQEAAASTHPVKQAHIGGRSF